MGSNQENKAESLISNRPGLIVIPPILYSLYDGPFAYCLVCSSNLLQGDTRYTIQRSFVNEEPVCEFALCVDSGDALRDEVSSQSIQKVETYFRDHVNIEDRNLNLLRRAFTNVELGWNSVSSQSSRGKAVKVAQSMVILRENFSSLRLNRTCCRPKHFMKSKVYTLK